MGFGLRMTVIGLLVLKKFTVMDYNQAVGNSLRNGANKYQNTRHVSGS